MRARGLRAVRQKARLTQSFSPFLQMQGLSAGLYAARAPSILRRQPAIKATLAGEY
jgi:hypothetical protein